MTILEHRPLLGAPTVWAVPTASSFSMSSGMSGKHLRVPGAQMLHATLFFASPLSEETTDEYGVTYLMARLLTEGAGARSGSDFAKAADRIAATLDASVSPDGIAVSLDVPLTHAAEGVALLASAITEPTFTSSEVERIKRLTLANLTMDEADPSAKVDTEYRRHLYERMSRWAVREQGDEHTLSNVSRAAIINRYEAAITAARGVVISAGALETHEVRNLFVDAFRGWTGTVSSPAPTLLPTAAVARTVFIDRPGASQTEVRVGAVTEGTSAPAWPGGLVAAHVLAGGMQSRLNYELREQRGYTYGVRARFTSNAGFGQFTMSGAFAAEHTGAALEGAARILREFRRNGPDEREHSAAVEAIVTGAPVSAQSARELQHLMVIGVATGSADDWYASQLLGVAATTPRSTVDDYRSLVPAALTTVILGDYRLCAPQLAAFDVKVDTVT